MPLAPVWLCGLARVTVGHHAWSTRSQPQPLQDTPHKASQSMPHKNVRDTRAALQAQSHAGRAAGLRMRQPDAALSDDVRSTLTDPSAHTPISTSQMIRRTHA